MKILHLTYISGIIIFGMQEDKIYKYVINNHAKVSDVESFADSSIDDEVLWFYRNYSRVSSDLQIPEEEIRTSKGLNLESFSYAELNYVLCLYSNQSDSALAEFFDGNDNEIQFLNNKVQSWYRYFRYWYLEDQKTPLERILLLKEILNDSPDFYLASVDLCLQYLQLNDINSARDQFRLIPELNRWEYHFVLGEILFESELYPGAEAAYLKSITIFPTSLALNALGFYYLNIDENDRRANFIRSEKYLEMALNLDSNNYIAMEGLGIICVSRNEFEKAEDWFSKSVAASKNEVVSLDRMAWFYLVTNHLDYAKVWIDELGKHYPESFEYHKNSLILIYLTNNMVTKEFDENYLAITNKFPARKNELIDYLVAFGIPFD